MRWSRQMDRPEAAQPNQRMQRSGAVRPELRLLLIAGGGQQSVEFGAAGIPPAADAPCR
jgi:hypothetical protein